MRPLQPHSLGPPSGSTAAAACPFARSSELSAASLAEALKESTREAHVRAEKHPLQARMVKGAVTLGEYIAWLEQMLVVWRTADAALQELAARDGRVAAMLKPYHVHAGRVAADLAFLGNGDAGGVPTPATTRFVEMIRSAAAGGPEVLGVWYVLEGSTNGGRFIAKAVSRGLGIAGPEGLISLDPHGEAQRERWQAWRAGLDAQDFEESERAGIVAAAAATFDAVYDLMEDLDARS